MKELFSTPIDNLLIIAGIVFLIISVVGNIDGKISPGNIGRIMSGFIGIMLLSYGLFIHLKQPTGAELISHENNREKPIVQPNINQSMEDSNELKELKERLKALEQMKIQDEQSSKLNGSLSTNDHASIEKNPKALEEKQTAIQESSSLSNAETKSQFEDLIEKANQGIPEAQNTLGYKYFKGTDIEQNDEEAVHWYQLAAAQGHVKAQNNLGWMYETSKGVKGDNETAIYWYLKAAEQGYIKAQLNLARLLRVVDIPGSIKWYRIAAEQGNIEAQKALEELVNPK
jgi:hypothetical protein